MALRVYRREGIKKGNWYYTVVCEGCQKPIHFLEDNSQGKSPVKLLGGDTFSIPCFQCAHEAEYAADQVSVKQADEDRASIRPPRVKTSPSPRQSLWKTHPDAKATFGVGFIEDRPKAAAIVGRIITSWADIEVQCTRLLAELMGTNIPAAAAVFGSLRSSRAQQDALDAAAHAVLSERDIELHAAYMKRRSSLEKQRNDLAHGCFGVSVQIPDDVIWVSQSDYLSFTASHKTGPSAEATEKFRKSQFVYTLGTLERISQEIEEYYHQLGFFSGYLTARNYGSQGDSFRAVRYGELCNQPHIGEILQATLAAKKAQQQASPANGKQK